MANKTSIKTKHVKQAVCPICYRHVQYPRVDKSIEKNGCVSRLYYGWCFECQKGFMVIQFLRGKSWLIHKWKPAVCLAPSGTVKLEADWIEIVPLDEPAVVTGPGGQYRRGYNPEAINTAEQISGYLVQIQDMLGELVDCLKGK